MMNCFIGGSHVRRNCAPLPGDGDVVRLDFFVLVVDDFAFALDDMVHTI